jgi:beta-carotene hydroxylase
MKPLLDEKGSPQSLGLMQTKDFLNFLYDLFLGIRFHPKPEKDTQKPTG